MSRNKKIQPNVLNNSDIIREKIHSIRGKQVMLDSDLAEIYGVEVVSVNTMNYSGKTKSRNTKAGLITGKTNSFKKAIVVLADGETIDFYSNI